MPEISRVPAVRDALNVLVNEYEAACEDAGIDMNHFCVDALKLELARFDAALAADESAEARRAEQAEDARRDREVV